MGRKGELDRPTKQAVLIALRAGVSEATAAAHAQITVAKLHAAYRADAAFKAAAEAARNEVQVLASGAIRQAMSEDWRAAAWYIQRGGADEELARLKALTTD